MNEFTANKRPEILNFVLFAWLIVASLSGAEAIVRVIEEFGREYQGSSFVALGIILLIAVVIILLAYLIFFKRSNTARVMLVVLGIVPILWYAYLVLISIPNGMRKLEALGFGIIEAAGFIFYLFGFLYVILILLSLFGVFGLLTRPVRDFCNAVKQVKPTA